MKLDHINKIRTTVLNLYESFDSCNKLQELIKILDHSGWLIGLSLNSIHETNNNKLCSFPSQLNYWTVLIPSRIIGQS